MKKYTSIVLIVLMLLTVVLPTTTIEASTQLAVEQERITIEDTLYDQFKKEKYVSYLVFLKEEANIERATAQATAASMIRKESDQRAIETKRSYIVNALKETAHFSQKPLIHYLEQEQNKQRVKTFREFFIVNAVAVTSTKEVMEQLAQFPQVEAIKANETYTLEVSEDVEVLEEDQGQEEQYPWNLQMMNVPEVHKKGLKGEGMTVAIIDSGVDGTHPALKDKWRGKGKEDVSAHWLDTTYEHDETPADKSGHGTHVAGSIVGEEKDGKNKIGVAPNAQWIAAKVFNAEGETSDFQLIEAGEWVMAPGGNIDLAPDVVNNSWGMVVAGKNEYYREIVKRWKEADIFPVFSAGNTRFPMNTGGEGSVTAPANYPESFSVGAIDEEQRLGHFSLQGPSPYGDTKPEVTAPGVAIRSAKAGGGYVKMNGTSMASPHVAGMIVLIRQMNRDLSVAEIEEIVKRTVVPLTDKEFPTSPNNGYGYGMVNALNAWAEIAPNAQLGKVTGRVVTAGVDTDAPVIQHESPGLTFPLLAHEVYANVSDDQGIKEVTLTYQINENKEQSIPMTLNYGTAIEGEYTAKVPKDELAIGTLTYVITAKDYSDNEVKTEKFTVQISEGITKGYKEDFEGEVTGFDFSQTDGVWEIGVPTNGPEKAVSGEKVLGTHLEHDYLADTESFIVTPLIDLRNEKTPTLLRFQQWFELGEWYSATYDTAEVLVGRKVDGEEEFTFDFEMIERWSSKGWQQKNIDLTKYNGEQIYIAFHLRGPHGGKPGWFIDDLEITTPEEGYIEPVKISARRNNPNRIIVEWEKGRSDQVQDYIVYRSRTKEGPYEKIGETKERSFGQVIPYEEQHGTFYYQVRARNFAQQLSEPSNVIPWTFTAGDVVYETTFEDGKEKDWTLGGEWNIESPKTGGQGPEDVAIGEKVIGTNVNFRYTGQQEHILTSPMIDLTNETAAALYYFQWYDMSDGEGRVEVSTDGEKWQRIKRAPTIPSDVMEPRNFWHLVEVDLTRYAGKQIYLRFVTESKQQNYSEAGWHLAKMEVRNTGPVMTKDLFHTDASVQAPIRWTDIQQVRKDAQLQGEPITANLPVQAQLTVKETNYSTKAAPGSGKYQLIHPTGNYQVLAEAYGFEPKQFSVNIAEQETVQHLQMTPLQKGMITGVIKDEKTGSPIAGAYVYLQEDSRVEPAITKEDGTFTLEAYVGHYTLRVAALHYYAEEKDLQVQANNEKATTISLRSFTPGKEREMKYDTGEMTNSYSLAGASVRMTVDEPVQVTKAKFLFHEDWPSPGGEEFYYAILAADGEKGAPQTILSGPFIGKGKRTGEWTTVDLPHPVIVTGDYYVAYFQKGRYPYVLGIGLESQEPSNGRSWTGSIHQWSPLEEEEGNLKIRSVVQPIATEQTTEDELIDLVITPERLTLKEKQKASLTATGVFRTAIGEEKKVIITEGVTYTSSDESIVTVSKDGKVTSHQEGTATLTVRYENKEKQVPVIVEKEVVETPTEPIEPEQPVAVLKTLQAVPQQVTVKEEESARLQLIGHYTDGSKRMMTDEEVTYRSLHPVIATVEKDGVIRGHRKGETMIEVVTNDQQVREYVPVYVQAKRPLQPEEPIDPVPVDPPVEKPSKPDPLEPVEPTNPEKWTIKELLLIPGKTVLKEGQMQQLQAVHFMKNALGATKYQDAPHVTYATTDASVVDVDQTGRIYAKKAGVAKIIAYAGDAMSTTYVQVDRREVQKPSQPIDPIAPVDPAVDQLKRIEAIPKETSLKEGQMQQMQVAAFYQDYVGEYNRLVTTDAQYTTLDASIVSVDKKGKVTAHRSGTTIIQVTYKGKSTSIRVTVERRPSSNGGALNLSKKHVHDDMPTGAKTTNDTTGGSIIYYITCYFARPPN